MSAPDAALRLRAGRVVPPFHVLLVEPEIPPNTGNVARLCAATQSRLHLIEPLGFRIDEHSVRRAGLDYWPLVDLHRHSSYASATAAIRAGDAQTRFWLLTGKASRSYLDVKFQPGDALVFGKESTGLDQALLDRFPADVFGIPTIGAVRSLNLANAVSIVLYEALRCAGVLDRAAPG